MKARKYHLKIAKPKESAPKTRAMAWRTDSKTCLTPQERGKAQHNQACTKLVPPERGKAQHNQACAKLVPPERGKAQHNQQRAWKGSKTPPEMRLHLTMKLSPDVYTLKDWNSPQSLRLRYQRHQTLPLRPNTNLSPLLTRHTPRYLPLSRCSPWKYAMKCNACVPKKLPGIEQEHLQGSKQHSIWGCIYKDNAWRSS